MNSEQRHELRYQRRKKKREERRRARCEQLGTVDEIFSFYNIFRYGKKCCKGVRWKQSTQNFELHLFSYSATTRKRVTEGRWKGKGYTHFLLSERGKVRPIDAPKIRDRVVHKILTEKVLYPLYRPSMIRDNGASQKYMGLSFAFNEVKKDLRRHFRKYGMTGVNGSADLKNFFPGCEHFAIFQRHDRYILDGKLRNLCDQVIFDFEDHTGTETGMPLGVEPSQIEMVSLPSKVDNHVKCQLSVKAFGHYMDDYRFTVNTRKEAEELLKDATHRFNNLGLRINPNKCKILSIDKPFKYCKATFRLLPTGRVLVRGNRASLKRARHKLKSFSIKAQDGQMDMKTINEWYQTQIAYFNNYDDHNRVLRLNRLYYNLFGGAYPCTKFSKKTEPKSA